MIPIINSIENKWSAIKQTPQARLFLPSIVALLGFFFIWIMVLPFGPRIAFHSDGFKYVWASKYIFTPEVIHNYRNYPPLHPILFSIPQFFGLSLFTSTGLVGAFGFGSLMFLCSRVLLDHTKSIAFFFLGTFSLFFSNEFLRWYGNVYSEGIYTLLHTSFALMLIQFIQSHSTKRLLGLACLGALCALQRYIGSIAVIYGCLILLTPLIKASFIQRLKYSVLFGFVASAPVWIWLLANLYIRGVFRGQKAESSPFLPIIYDLLSMVSGSLARLGHFPTNLRIIVFLLILSTILIVIFLEKNRDLQLLIGVFCSFNAFYIIYYGILRLFADIEMSFRFILPVVPALLIVYVIGIEHLWFRSLTLWQNFARITKLWKALRVIGLFIWFVLLAKAVVIDVKFVQNVRENGWPNRAHIATRKAISKSELIQWLQTNQFDGEILTYGGYARDLIFLYTGKGMEPSEIKKSEKKKKEKRLVVFNNIFPKDGPSMRIRNGPLFPTPEEMDALEIGNTSLERLAVFEDSAVYQVIELEKE